MLGGEFIVETGHKMSQYCLINRRTLKLLVNLNLYFLLDVARQLRFLSLSSIASSKRDVEGSVLSSAHSRVGSQPWQLRKEYQMKELTKLENLLVIKSDWKTSR